MDAIRLLKGVREGKKGDEAKEAIAEFIKLVEQTLEEQNQHEVDERG